MPLAVTQEDFLVLNVFVKTTSLVRSTLADWTVDCLIRNLVCVVNCIARLPSVEILMRVCRVRTYFGRSTRSCGYFWMVVAWSSVCNCLTFKQRDHSHHSRMRWTMTSVELITSNWSSWVLLFRQETRLRKRTVALCGLFIFVTGLRWPRSTSSEPELEHLLLNLRLPALCNLMFVFY